jgi:hypothetical protein
VKIPSCSATIAKAFVEYFNEIKAIDGEQVAVEDLIMFVWATACDDFVIVNREIKE